MNKAALIYILSIVAVTALHFGHRAVEHYTEARQYNMLRLVFNTKIQSITSKQERMYYMLARKLVLYNRYFGHLDLMSLITVCSKENYNTMCREWASLRIRPKDIFLVFSIPYNMGMFLPIFLPIVLHLLKAAKVWCRRLSGP